MLNIRRKEYEALRRHGEETYPHECCGALLGRFADGEWADEDAVKAGSVPYTILRASQFFEFIGRIVDSGGNGEAIHLPSAFVQPESADDVASTLADVTVNAPVNGIVELGGPEQFRMDVLARLFLEAHHDVRLVETDDNAPYFGAVLQAHSLRPGPDARIAPTRLDDWLSQSVPA